MSSPQPGGFLPSALLSPAPSTASTSFHSSTLPTPRHYPLKSGSTKETAFINHVDHGIQQVTRRYAIKFTSEDAPEGPSAHAAQPTSAQHEAKGYESFKEVGNDIERLAELVWVSGTPSLQIPYLLSLALLVVSYLPAFPPVPKTTIRLLGKLDLAFASLLQGTDVESGDALPGFGAGGRKGISATEKVRMKGIVEKTRVVVVEVMNRGEFEYEEESQDDQEQEDEDMIDEEFERGNDWELEIARVYERTLVKLGDTLSGPEIGIPTS